MKILAARRIEIMAIAILLIGSITCVALPFTNPIFVTQKYTAIFNAILSIGTGGLVSFFFYYIVNERLENRRRRILQSVIHDIYRSAKRDIAVAVIHASQKGGRADLVANSDTIEQMLTTNGFKALFSDGRESDEGYYAFENQMDSRTPEYEEIIFNLKVIARAAERLIDNGAASDEATYGLIMRLGIVVERIERNGPGYDESKPLCGLIWQVFSGWSSIDGDLGYDPIQRAIEKL